MSRSIVLHDHDRYIVALERAGGELVNGVENAFDQDGRRHVAMSFDAGASGAKPGETTTPKKEWRVVPGVAIGQLLAFGQTSGYDAEA